MIPATTGGCSIAVRRGSLHFNRTTYERFFAGLDSVVLLRDGADLIVIPVRHRAAGGTVIKQRNAAGDRTVMAAEFLRDNGIEDGPEMTRPATWSEERSALIVTGVFG